ncbi:hypothetical protein [Segatella bryantii]|uniref:hypothetical protein n=1 Tax=Segatella bryantii TaxID=77095 RepID=UPI002432FBD0|nr:hypothetical protein [Segatella bryantii]
MYSQPELIYSIACSAYVVTCLMFAAVRWFHVIFLISILPSKRKGNLFDYAPTEEQPHTCCIEKAVKAERKLKEIPQQTRKRISDGIERVLVQQRLYLNPNLSLKEVVEGCGYSQAYVSRVLREQYGGFYDYVNLLRCRHVDIYAKQHPEVTMEESIIKSGFKKSTNLLSHQKTSVL